MSGKINKNRSDIEHLITKEIIDSKFIVDVINGKIYHKPRKTLRPEFWNKEAIRKTDTGYLIINFFDEKRVRQHRVIFFYHYGYWPYQIDHIDGNKTNNKIDNLRECTESQNKCNIPKRKSNSSGQKNIFRTSDDSCYEVKICINKCINYCGRFATIAEAIICRDIELLRLHKEFSNFK